MTKKTKVCRAPKLALRRAVAGAPTKGVTPMAQHLWHNGCREAVTRNGVGISWGRFLGLVKENWYLFQSWANGNAAWEITLQLFLDKAKKELDKLK